jgi:hypothetical protein
LVFDLEKKNTRQGNWFPLCIHLFWWSWWKRREWLFNWIRLFESLAQPSVTFFSISVHPPTERPFFLFSKRKKKSGKIKGINPWLAFSLFSSRYLREHGRGRTRKQSNNYLEEPRNRRRRREKKASQSIYNTKKTRFRYCCIASGSANVVDSAINISATPSERTNEWTKKK